MAYSLADLTTRTRDALNEATAAFYSDAQIQRWLGDAAAEISGITRSFEAVATITLATGDQTYSVPSNAIDVKHLTYQATGQSLVKITPSMAGKIIAESTSALPPYWYEFAGTIYVDPFPTSAANNLVINVFYTKTTQDVTELPWSCQLACVYYACAMGKLKDKAPGEAAMFWSMFINATGFRRTDIFARDPMTRAELTFSDEAVTGG